MNNYLALVYGVVSKELYREISDWISLHFNETLYKYTVLL